MTKRPEWNIKTLSLNLQAEEAQLVDLFLAQYLTLLLAQQLIPSISRAFIFIVKTIRRIQKISQQWVMRM